MFKETDGLVLDQLGVVVNFSKKVYFEISNLLIFCHKQAENKQNMLIQIYNPDILLQKWTVAVPTFPSMLYQVVCSFLFSVP